MKLKCTGYTAHWNRGGKVTEKMQVEVEHQRKSVNNEQQTGEGVTRHQEERGRDKA